MGLWMVQLWVLRLGMWVLEVELGFERLLVHTGRWPIVRKCLLGFLLFFCLKKFLLYLLKQSNLLAVLQKSCWCWGLICEGCVSLDRRELEGHLMLVSVDDQVLL